MFILELSDGILHLSFKMLIELCGLHKAVSEASFLVSQELILAQANEAASVAFFHGAGGHFLVELLLHLVAEDSKIVSSFLCWHFLLILN